MAIQARDYQQEAVQSIYRYFGEKAGNPLVAMPTGTGKSVVIAMFLQSIFRSYPLQRVMVLTHVKELIQQNFAKLLEAWPTAPAGIYSAGIGRRDTMQKILVAGIASVAKRAALFGRIDLVLIDEAHLVSPADETLYLQFLAELRAVNPFVKVIGFTATGWRLGHGKLHENHPVFTDVCFDITGLHAFNRLLQEGYLCPLVPKSTTAKLDTDGVHMRGGEFIASELQDAVDKHHITQAALREAVQLAGDRRSWLLFCAGVEHAIHVAEALTSMGIPCKAVHSKMSDKERDDTIADWKAGRLWAIANNNVMTTGIDHPSLDCIVMLRPTASTVLWVQMLGRGTRPVYAPGYDLSIPQGRLDAIAASHKQNCLVLDFARNTPRLGPINDPVIPRRKGEKVGEAPIKLCPSCATYNHASARHCIVCGAEFPQYGPRIGDTAGTDALIKDDTPVTEVFKVDHVTYSMHTKVGRPPMMKVSYYCGLKMFQEYVCFEHPDNFSQRKARKWWRERVPGPHAGAAVPDSTVAALKLAEHLCAPTHLRVWVNKQYPEILQSCMDGTAFGTQEAAAGPDVASDHASSLPQNSAQAVAARAMPFDLTDDDIPF